MGFWGLEVKPGKPQSYHPKNEQGKLHLTQATLGAGHGGKNNVVQCSIGDKTPVYLCSLLPKINESCPLNLEFDDDDDPVVFSVTGDRSIHLSGFLEDYEQDEEDDSGDISETESGESSDYDIEEDQMDELEDFLDSNLEMYRNSSVPKSGVVIEEIEDEEKSTKDTKTKVPKKKSHASEDENAKNQIIAVESTHVPVLESEDEDEYEIVHEDECESEDEDGFPIVKEEASEQKNKKLEKMDLGDDEHGSKRKRKAASSEQDGVQESVNKNKKKKNQKEKKRGESASYEEADEQVQTGNKLKKQETNKKSSSMKAQNGTANNDITESSKTPNKSAEKKNKKKKKNSNEEGMVEGKTISDSAENQISDSKSKGNKVNSKSSPVRTYPNGLVVEELALGKPNAKKADPGKEVRVRYIGKLQKNGKIFDSNIGKAPFKFRLGAGQVIKGWDVGVNGMRVGDKRRLTIPPSMGYGEHGAGGGLIPRNAWLTFDVELIDVK